MSRKLMAILVSSSLALASVSTTAWSTSDPAAQVNAAAQSSSQASNVPPLSPGGAAGIRQAQGTGNEGWIIAGFVAVFLLFVLLDSGDDDDDNDTPSGTGTN